MQTFTSRKHTNCRAVNISKAEVLKVGDFASQEHLAICGDVFGSHRRKGHATASIQRVEPRVAAKHPTVLRKVLHKK